MNPKYEVIKLLFGPLITFFKEKLLISPILFLEIFIILELIFIMRNKSKEYRVTVMKIVLWAATIIGLIAGIKFTLELRISDFIAK